MKKIDKKTIKSANNDKDKDYDNYINNKDNDYEKYVDDNNYI